jgi:hypothetical protein
MLAGACAVVLDELDEPDVWAPAVPTTLAPIAPPATALPTSAVAIKNFFVGCMQNSL